MIFPYRAIETGQLNEELAGLNLPGFTGIATGTRDPDTGNYIPRYIWVKTDPLTLAQEAQVTAVLAAHTPVPLPPRRDYKAEYAVAVTETDKLSVIAARLGLI